MYMDDSYAQQLQEKLNLDELENDFTSLEKLAMKGLVKLNED